MRMVWPTQSTHISKWFCAFSRWWFPPLLMFMPHQHPVMDPILQIMLHHIREPRRKDCSLHLLTKWAHLLLKVNCHWPESFFKVLPMKRAKIFSISLGAAYKDFPPIILVDKDRPQPSADSFTHLHVAKGEVRPARDGSHTEPHNFNLPHPWSQGIQLLRLVRPEAVLPPNSLYPCQLLPCCCGLRF